MSGTDYPRDLKGYGRRPPDPNWPGQARVAVQFVTAQTTDQDIVAIVRFERVVAGITEHQVVARPTVHAVVAGIGEPDIAELAPGEIYCILRCGSRMFLHGYFMIGNIGETRDVARNHPEIVAEPVLQFYSQANSDDLLDRGFDCVVDAIDNGNTKAHLLAACRDEGIPLDVAWRDLPQEARDFVWRGVTIVDHET